MLECAEIEKYVMTVVMKNGEERTKEFHNIEVLELNMKQAIKDKNVKYVRAQEIRNLIFDFDSPI